MRMRSCLLSASLSALVLACALVAPAAAQDLHPGHNPARRCVWQTNLAPSFVPGNDPVLDSGSTVRRSTVFETVVGRTAWDVVVLPGYHFGWVYVWDEGVPLESTCTKAYARSSVYSVMKSVDCCRPERSVTPTVACSFRVRARQLNDPGSASAQGVTCIRGRNTGVTCVATAAATTRSDEAGMTATVQVPLPTGGNTRVTFNLDFDGEDESVDSASNLVLGRAMASPDEEYSIVTDLDLDAEADGAPWDTGAASADLMQHDIWIRTVLECRHCSTRVVPELFVDDRYYGQTEKSCDGD